MWRRDWNWFYAYHWSVCFHLHYLPYRCQHCDSAFGVLLLLVSRRLHVLDLVLLWPKRHRNLGPWPLKGRGWVWGFSWWIKSEIFWWALKGRYDGLFWRISILFQLATRLITLKLIVLSFLDYCGAPKIWYAIRLGEANWHTIQQHDVLSNCTNGYILVLSTTWTHRKCYSRQLFYFLFFRTPDSKTTWCNLKFQGNKYFVDANICFRVFMTQNV